MADENPFAEERRLGNLWNYFEVFYDSSNMVDTPTQLVVNGRLRQIYRDLREVR